MFFLLSVFKIDSILLARCTVFFRILMAVITAFLIVIFFCPWFIKKIKFFNFNQPVRNDGPVNHLKKIGTPTFGGLSIILGILCSVFVWADLSSVNVLLLICIMLSFALIGLLDDYRKVKDNSSNGLAPSKKLLSQFFSGGIILVIYHLFVGFKLPVFFKFTSIGFFQLPGIDIAICSYFIFALFLLLGTSNSVNLTDGLDGLAAVAIFFSSLLLLFLILISGDMSILNTNSFFCILESTNSEIAVFCASVVGAVVGFLWYNMFPACLFMGDVGSLSIGAVIGLMVIMTRTEIFSIFFNIIFFLETISVIFQVLFFKIFKKRIFKMAPIHHHFEILKYPENVIVVRFWIINAFIFLISLIIAFRVK